MLSIRLASCYSYWIVDDNCIDRPLDTIKNFLYISRVPCILLLDVTVQLSISFAHTPMSVKNFLYMYSVDKETKLMRIF